MKLVVSLDFSTVLLGMYNFYALGEPYTAMQEQQPGPTPSNHAAKWRKETLSSVPIGVASIPRFSERLNRHFCSLPYYTLTKGNIGMENKKNNLSRSKSWGSYDNFSISMSVYPRPIPCMFVAVDPRHQAPGVIGAVFQTPCNAVRHWLLKNGMISLWVMIMTHILGKGNATQCIPVQSPTVMYHLHSQFLVG